MRRDPPPAAAGVAPNASMAAPAAPPRRRRLEGRGVGGELGGVGVAIVSRRRTGRKKSAWLRLRLTREPERVAQRSVVLLVREDGAQFAPESRASTSVETYTRGRSQPAQKASGAATSISAPPGGRAAAR